MRCRALRSRPAARARTCCVRCGRWAAAACSPVSPPAAAAAHRRARRGRGPRPRARRHRGRGASLHRRPGGRRVRHPPVRAGTARSARPTSAPCWTSPAGTRAGRPGRVGRGHRRGAAGASPGFYAALVRSAARRPAIGCSSTPPGEQLAGALRERPELVKVNLAEACSAVGEPFARCCDEKSAAPRTSSPKAPCSAGASSTPAPWAPSSRLAPPAPSACSAAPNGACARARSPP